LVPFVLAGPVEFDLFLFGFIASSPMFSSSGSSGINGVTVGIGLVAMVEGITVGFIVFLKLDRPLCGSVCFGLRGLLGVPIYVSAGWLRVGGIAIFIGTAAAPAPGAPGGGACPPLLYTVASGSPGLGGPISIAFCLLSTLRNAFCCV